MAETDDPIVRFSALLTRAKAAVKGRDYNAMSVASVDEQGHPHVRIVLLKGVDDRGFVFYTNLTSRKGRELQSHPWSSLCFHWPELDAQVRVDGRVERVTDPEADAYFASRARQSQLGAWASLQSQTLGAREELLQRLHDFEKEYEGRDVPRPPHWSGLRVVPLSIEFWHNQPSRLHDRELFERDSETDGWQLRRLYP